MNIVVNFSMTLNTLIIILLNWFLLKCHCHERIEVTPISPSQADKRYFHKLSNRLTNRSLSIVDLRHRAFKSIPEDVLRLYDTEILDLEDNRLTDLPTGLANLTKIEYINLTGNRISNISSINVIDKLSNLEHLILSKNPLKSLGGLRVESLLFLEAGHCEIQKIDNATLSSVPSLKSLNLTGNPLGVMQKLMSENLIELVLTNCQLKGLCFDALKGLPNLRYFDICGNKFNTLPDKIFTRNNNLVQLNVCNNSLQRIKSVWFEKKLHLHQLDLSDNKIGTIGKTVFANLSQLSNLNLAGNRVISLPDFTTTAVHLNLSRNYIKNRDSWDLSNMTRLENLDLSNNQLEGDCDEFRSTSLQKLDLGYNKLTKIREKSLSALPNLEDLILRGNRFTRGTDLFFENNTNLVYINLDDNPWHCDCSELHPLYFYLSYDRKTIITNLKCKTPVGNTWPSVCSTQWQLFVADENQANFSKTWFIGMSISFIVCLLVGLLAHVVMTFLKIHRGRNL